MKTVKKPIILFLSWRDFQHPASGGAEVYTTEMISRGLTRKKYRIVHFSTMTKGNQKITRDDDIIYIKKGNWISVLLFSMLFYFKNSERIHLVVDQCNTHRFFTPFWVPKNKRVFFIHQLTREVWRTKLPRPISFLGEWLEDRMLKIYRGAQTITVSPSTKKDLKDLGFKESMIRIIPEGVSHSPVELPLVKKNKKNVFLYVGRYSEYKGLPDAVRAFAHFLKKDESSQLIIIGSRNEKYINEVLFPICKEFDIQISDTYNENSLRTLTLLGRVDEEEKLKFMSDVTALLYPSKREGWGLTISEAAVLGTPSIVYNSPGLIDAVNQGKAGFLCEDNSYEGLLKKMSEVVYEPEKYEKMRSQAYDFSKVLSWDQTAVEFDKFISDRSA